MTPPQAITSGSGTRLRNKIAARLATAMPVVIACGGVIGLAAYQTMHPTWLLK